MNEPTQPHLDRRHLIRGAALLGVAVPVLAACGEDEEPASTVTTPDSPSATQDGSASPDGGGGGALVPAADVPVGGGVILDGEKVVVTQPAEGEFKAFSAICTHQGCPVGSVEDGTINCPCHGSKFSVEDGSVVTGPATSPLPAIEVGAKGGDVVRL